MKKNIMKKITKLVLFFALIAIACPSFAQSIGIKAGLNMANMLVKDDDETYSDDYEMKPGLHLGVVAELPLSDPIALEAGLLFSMKGFKMEENGVEAETNLNYLDIPVNLKAGFDVGNAKLIALAGPYFGIGLSGKTKIEGGGEEIEEDIEWGNDEVEDDLKRLDFGLGLGAGVEFGAIGVSAVYNLGLSNISPFTEGGYKVSNRAIQVSVSYFFGK